MFSTHFFSAGVLFFQPGRASQISSPEVRWETFKMNRFAGSEGSGSEIMYLEFPSKPLKMVGQTTQNNGKGHGPIFISGQRETPGTRLLSLFYVTYRAPSFCWASEQRSYSSLSIYVQALSLEIGWCLPTDTWVPQCPFTLFWLGGIPY